MNEATREIGIVSTMMNVALQRPRKTKTTSITMMKVMKIVSLRLFTVLTMKSEVSEVLQGHGFSRWGYGAASDGLLNVKRSSESAKTDFQTTPMGLSIRGIVKLLKGGRDSLSRLLGLARYKKVV